MNISFYLREKYAKIDCDMAILTIKTLCHDETIFRLNMPQRV